MRTAIRAAVRVSSLMAVALSLSGTVFAAGPAVAPEVPPLQPPHLVAKPAGVGNPAQSHSAAELFSRPVSLRGTLGQRKIQMRLQPHAEFEDSVQGGYFEFGHRSQKIALAGEYQGNELVMDESVDGTNVSGQWSGSVMGNTYSGNWYGEGESSAVPFALTVFEPAP